MMKMKSLLLLATAFIAAQCTVVEANPAKIIHVKLNPHQTRAVPAHLSCLNSQLTLSNPTNWYAQATLTITNNCGSSQKLNNAIVSFQSNSNNISPMWGGANSSSSFTYKGNIASTVLNIQNDPLPINKTLTLSFGINLTGTPFDLTSANSTLTVGTNTPTPANGEIDVTVDPSAAADYSGTSEIDIAGPGLTQPYVIVNSSWTAPTTFKVTGLSYGTYTVTAQPVGNQYLGSATPANVTLNSATPAPVQISYTLAPATGSLQINLAAAPLTGIASNVNAILTDNTTNQSQTINIAWNSFKLISNLPVGDNYTVTFPEVSNGVSYSDADTIAQPIILQGRTTPLNVSYLQAQPMPSQSVVFNVSGLSATVQGAVTIVDNFGNNFNLSGIGNGQSTQALPVNDTFSVSATAPGMFATISPSSFTLVNGQTPPAISITYAANPTPATGSNFFAYADSGMQTNNNGLVPPKGANMVEAFILFNPWENKSDLWAVVMGDPISQIIKNTPNTFASVGGANGPYPWDYETVAQGVTEFEALVDYYGFIGLDFDVEGAALETPSVQTWVSNAVLQLHKDRPNLILTLTVPDPIIGFTPGTTSILSKTLAGNNNKMVFNWINKMDFDEAGLDIGAGCTQTDTNMNNNCLVKSASAGAQQLATILGIDQQTAYQYLGLIFMVPVDDQGHQLPLSLATTVATTTHGMGITHMGYWSLQRDTNLTYGNMFTHTLGLS